MSFALASDPDPLEPDRVVVIGGGPETLALLRLATIRTDDVVLVGLAIDDAARHYARRFAIEHVARPASDADLVDANAVLMSLDDLDEANAIVRSARRRGVPLHVSGRPLVSDFNLLAFLERRPSASAASALPL